ncbi:MAG: hypothetical protein RL430_303 [Actinomycetota bacterium]
MIEVRPAVAADSGALEHFVAAAESESHRYRGHIDADARPSTSVVATIAGDVVGAVWYVDEGPVRLVTLVHVHESARGVGVGDALMDFVLRDAASSGCTHVRSTALPGDRATKNLFERNGLVARAIQVEKKLA